MGDREISELLAAEAERMEKAQPARRHTRSTVPPQDPSQVYSIRIPQSHLERLRRLAVEKGERPTALLRRWALERLSVEMDRSSADARSLLSARPSFSIQIVAVDEPSASYVKWGVIKATERMSA
jgi:hypothetical protein